MRSDADRSALLDILRNIALAADFTRNQSFENFRDDLMRQYAVTRCLEIVLEASRRLSTQLKGRHPGVPWREIAGAGNVYRHDYEDVAAQRIWDTVQKDLPPLRSVVEQELGQP